MKEQMVKLFGASWVTTVLGYVGILGSGAELLLDAIAKNGMPTNAASWITLVLSIGLTITKQQNVTNAAEPVAAKVIQGPTPIKTVIQEGQEDHAG